MTCERLCVHLVHVYVRMRVCAHVHVACYHVHAYVHKGMHVCVRAQVCMSKSVCVLTSAHEHAYVHKSAWGSVFVHVYVSLILQLKEK